MKFIRPLAAVLLTLIAATAQAHKASDSYLDLTPDSHGHIAGRWDIALRDLDVVLALDANNDRHLTWGEVRPRTSDIAGYTFRHLALSEAGKACPAPLLDQPLAIEEHADGHYAVLQFSTNCPQPGALKIGYELFGDVDALHRGITTVHGADVQTVVLAPGSASTAFAPAPAANITLTAAAPVTPADTLATLWPSFRSFVGEGMHHIATGYDHLLFLLSLLLPAALIRNQQRWAPVPRGSQALWDTTAVVTAFTLAHSITLALAALDVVRLPSRLVESLIAISVVLAALHNLWPRFHRLRWGLAFSFGLVHGLGFASALSDLPVRTAARAVALAGFNIGVELGQLSFVAAFLPLALLLRRRPAYVRYVLNGGSLVIAGVATVWLVQRACNLQLIPG